MRRPAADPPAAGTGACPLPVARSLCWATYEEAERLGVLSQGTRQWAYRWIEEHVKRLAPVRTIADIGGGTADSVLADRLSPCATRVIVVDAMASGRRRGNVEELAIDLEQGLVEMGDASIDVLVTASSLEHLTASGQQRIFAEAERVLAAGGVFCGTMSYITGLDVGTLAILARDPALAATGSRVQDRVDVRACLAAAPGLRVPFPPAHWSAFPGFDGFHEQQLLGSDAFVAGRVGSYGSVRCLPEVDALGLAWYELGFFLWKAA